MYNLQEISLKGKLFRQQFNEIDFVGEIEIPEVELESLCSSLWKYLQHTYNNEDLAALLTVVVVNLAFYTREDLNSNSLRWLVLNKLSGIIIEDTALWEDSVGTPVLRTLKSHFQIQDLPGPNRYVRPILQQAGVPYSAIPQFVKFFLQLVNNYGLPFTHQNYQRFRDSHQILSSVLSNFLATEAGFLYCQEIGRIYTNVRNRLLISSEVEDLPPRVRETIKALQRSAGEIIPAQIKKLNTNPPQLALDKEQLRLKLIFPDELLNSTQLNYELKDVGVVYQKSYFLEPEQLSKSKISGLTKLKGKTEEWEVKIWQPQTNPWAIFSISSGSFIQSSGKIDPGEYLIVIPFEYDLPEIIEDYGYFYYPGDITFRVFHAQLTDGFQIPEIGFEVGSNSSSIPYLRFSDSKNLVRYGTNVFLEKSPKIVIGNWNENTLKDYFLVLKKDNISNRIPDDHLTDGVLNYSFEAPIQVQIKLEPKGKTVKGFLDSNLSFTVIPKDFKFYWRSVLYEKDATPNLEIKSADKIEIVGQNTSLKQVGPGKWEILPEIEILDLPLKYQDSFVFSLTVPVYRLTFTSEIIEDGMLWQDKLNRQTIIFISFSSNERRQNVEIGIIIAGKFTKICDSKPVPSNLLLELTTDEVKNAFEDCGIPTGLLAIKTRSGNVVRSDIVYANEELIKSRTFDEDDKFNEWSEILPEDLRLSLEGKRKFHLKGETQNEELPKSVPDLIKDWLDDPRQDFQVIRKSIREWSDYCRNQHWQKAMQTDIGSEPEGKKLIESVKTYHDALEALDNNNLKKYNLFLESSYHKLKIINSTEGLISQIAVFLRFICCLRLNEFDAAVQESKLFEESWNGIIFQLKNKFLNYTYKKRNSEETFTIDEILIHKKDLELFDGDKATIKWN